jgi:hypothetical protein
MFVNGKWVEKKEGMTVTDLLRQCGDDGWELVAAHESRASGYEFFFKRPKS